MTNESPFFLSKVECPICKTVNEFETVRVGSYYENGRDTDFCPMEIKWRYPRYEGYNPLVFFTATCSHCYYTREFTNNFKEWKNDNNYRMYRLKTVKEKHLDCLATADSVLKKMGESIDVARHPNESAIMKLNIAIFDEFLCDRVCDLDLGRFYLRVGWVFRDLDKGENPGTKLLKGLILEIDNKFAVLKAAVQNGNQELDTFSRHLYSHFETGELSTEISSRLLPYREQFDVQVKLLDGLLRETDSKVSDITALMDEYKGVALGGDGASGGAGFGPYASFTEFLIELKKSWDGIVINEQEALERAIHYYKEAFAGGRDISPGNQQLQASYLIAELSRRIGDHDGARQYFNSTIKHGQEFIYQNRNDSSRTALARKILELAIEQGKANMQSLKST